MFIKVNGVELYFDVEGVGLAVEGPTTVERPTVVAIHGGPALYHTTLKPWLSPLANVAQVIYLDHGGTGRSSEASLGTYRMEQIADDVEALRTHLGLGRIAVLGASYGGFVALTYALRYPASVAQLLLIGTSPSHRFWARSQEILATKGTPEQVTLGPTLLDGSVSTDEEYLRWWSTMLPLYFVTPSAQLVEEVIGRVRGNVKTAQEMLRHDLPHYDVEERLGEITAPTFVASGIHDWIQPTEQSRLIAERVSSAELFLYEESGRFPYIEEADRFSADLVGFLSSHS